MARAERVLPGGVSSPVRAFGAVGGTPVVFRSGRGAMLQDVDGKEYVDFVGSWGPLILGHAHPEVRAAIEAAAARGTSFGAPSEPEIELAELIVSWYPGLEQVRFTSSGTEAVMSAIRVARGATGRDLIVKFSGCYHGHADHLLVSAGSGLVTFGHPSSAGVPEAFTQATLVLPLDDEQRVRDLFARHGADIAAVIIEPVPANNGLLLQRADFLRTVRAETQRAGALLIFDEVISGFRLSRGGAAEWTGLGITPDLATFGKVIGGGLPVGAFGGRREIMRHLAPLGAVYQAGTLSGNAAAMSAGLATLRVLEREQGWATLEAIGCATEDALAPVVTAAGGRFVRAGSLFWMSLQPGDPPRSAEALDGAAGGRYAPVFHALLGQGVALAPSAYEVGFLSLAHTPAHVERLRDALAGALGVSTRSLAESREPGAESRKPAAASREPAAASREPRAV